MTREQTTTRAVSSIFGFSLLLVIVVMAALGILLTGTHTISNAQSHVQAEHVEQGFVELKHAMSTTADSPDTTRAVDLDVGGDEAILKRNTGCITIKYDDLEGTLREPLTFGTLEYEGADGTTIAHEAGAVFRETGAETQVVSTPEIQYDNASNTLNFPVLEIVGEEELPSGSMNVKVNSSSGFTDVVENNTVVITIESEYWRGWEQYLVDEVGERGVIAEPHDDSEKGTVTVNLGRIDHPTPFENAVYVEDSLDSRGAVTINGTVSSGDALHAIDDEIATRVETAKQEYENEGRITGGEYTAGNYYAEAIDLDEELVVNLSRGDATFVVNGSLTVGNEFRVKNWGENELKIYTTGNLSVGSSVCLDSTGCTAANPYRPGELQPGQLHVYGTSNFSFTMSGNTYFEGVIYAPQGTAGGSTVADFTGNQRIDGSLVIGSVDKAAGNPTITHEESLKWLDPAIGAENQSPEITYLNLAYHEMEVQPE